MSVASRCSMLVLLGCLALSACNRSVDDAQTVRFWAMGSEGEVADELLREFERRNPDIHVQLQQLPWKGAHAKLLTAVAGGSTPDLAQLGNTWIPEMVALHALAPLDRKLVDSTVVRADDYFAGIFATNRIGDAVYGVPWYVDTRLLFYRRDLLAAAGFDVPPQTWADWRQALDALKARTGPDQFSILLPLNEFEPLLVLALQQEDPLLRDGGRYGNFRSAGFRRALAFYLEMFAAGLAPPVSNTQIANVWTEFGRGTFAFYPSGPWNIAEFKRRLPAAQQGDWAAMPMPGPQGPGASNAGGASLVVFAASKAKPAAWRLIEFLSEPAVQSRFYALTGNLPPRRSAWSDSALAGDEHVQAFRDQLERAKPTPAIPEWEQIATEMQLVAEQAVLTGQSVDAAVTEIDRRVDAILSKRRWMLDRERP
ncbi:MAG: sugar ABC transporter substrate-binding protein [Xanthomonadaceae bacterium]|nr:sugar ABC transporter substrate-binding protein [Xanthomonadaceae bacterium]MDP2186468.1 sugar ABC transporter substrate-binding protein [Xanthomonadales bacterium]MDZ4117388.1 sugar ABC transporter substrate-binding protein [Xanthomonadaceae bacterium]MDZ4379592.1 sugar ABC transporter substrate-binding protein [Xanthomonadaceae bacterium]